MSKRKAWWILWTILPVGIVLVVSGVGNISELSGAGRARRSESRPSLGNPFILRSDHEPVMPHRPHLPEPHNRAAKGREGR